MLARSVSASHSTAHRRPIGAGACHERQAFVRKPFTTVAPGVLGGQRTSIPRRTALALSLASFSSRVMAAESSKQPENFPYIQLWATADGETHIKEFIMKGFDLKKYASGEQLVKEGPKPLKVIFTELAVGLENDYHCCPQVQLVITLKGSWMIKTSDGTEKTMMPGDVLFQDNTKDSPAAKAKKPEHFSATVGDEPCQQLIIQLDRKPEVDNPGALSA